MLVKSLVVTENKSKRIEAYKISANVALKHGNTVTYNHFKNKLIAICGEV